MWLEITYGACEVGIIQNFPQAFWFNGTGMKPEIDILGSTNFNSDTPGHAVSGTQKLVCMV